MHWAMPFKENNVFPGFLCELSLSKESGRHVEAWWFSNTSHRLGYENRQKAAIGITHTIDGQPVLCKHGLHASATILDAFRYADGPVAWRVALSGTVVHGEDKIVATERTYLQGGIPIGTPLRKFIRMCALDVIMRIRKLMSPEEYKHLRIYLKTGKIGMVREAKRIVHALGRLCTGLCHCEDQRDVAISPGDDNGKVNSTTVRDCHVGSSLLAMTPSVEPREQLMQLAQYPLALRIIEIAVSAWSAIVPFAHLKKKVLLCLALHETLIDQPDKNIYEQNMNRRLERLVTKHWTQTL
jgi:hypothetical protein